MKIFLTSCVLLASLMSQTSNAAGSWWNNDWKYRKEIGFDLTPAGGDVAASAQDVPVLVRLSLANFSYFNDTKPDGADFRVIAGDDKTLLKYHFEKYDAQNQMALLWVRMPQLTGAAKTDKIYAYYGNPSAPSAADVAGTYDAAQVLDLSFSDAAGIPQDATAYKNNPSASSAELTPASLIGGGAKFDGKQSITIPATTSLRLLPNQGLTLSLWMRMSAAQSATVLSMSDQGKELSLTVNGTKLAAHAAFGAAPAVIDGGELSLNQWHHVALTAGAGKLALFVDGVPAGTATANLAEIGGTLTIGAGNNTAFFSGDVDEVEVAKVARSPDWIKASARAQGVDSNMILYGADGQQEGGGQSSYFVTIAKNLTIDGWVVIGICMAMLVVALLIMIWKAIVLRRVERANAGFLEEFRRTSGNMMEFGSQEPNAVSGESVGANAAMGDNVAPGASVPVSANGSPGAVRVAALADAAEQYGASTLYRLYHSGVFELDKRISGTTVSAARARVLSHQSIDAIRASMDATLTRLQQRLSSQMVLLTIAISGGPFLGLLGTVIGVMITFAAIALSGDVNINAIAPGTAAALAATVAGLTVAIPSLFGYNWLNARIKAISADNRVFVDEFVTRIAEQYS